MVNELWCKVCNQAVATTLTRVAGLAIVPLAGAVAALVPKMLRRRLGPGSVVLQGAVGVGVGFLANRYLMPLLAPRICGRCGGDVSRAAA
jgi:hypothetical protein